MAISSARSVDDLNEVTELQDDSKLLVAQGGELKRIFFTNLKNVLWSIINKIDNLASSTSNGLMSKEDKVALDGKQDKLTAGHNIIIDEDTNEISCDISTMNFRGTVAAYKNLPTTGLDTGDVYHVESEDKNYCWNGTAWFSIGGTMDIIDDNSSATNRTWSANKLSTLNVIVNITKAQYNALPDATKKNGTVYNITDEDAGLITTTNTVESGNMSAVTSNAVNSALTNVNNIRSYPLSNSQRTISIKVSGNTSLLILGANIIKYVTIGWNSSTQKYVILAQPYISGSDGITVTSDDTDTTKFSITMKSYSGMTIIPVGTSFQYL